MLNFGVMPTQKVRHSYPFALNAFHGGHSSDQRRESVGSAEVLSETKDIDSAELHAPSSPLLKSGKKVSAAAPATYAKGQT